MRNIKAVNAEERQVIGLLIESNLHIDDPGAQERPGYAQAQCHAACLGNDGVYKKAAWQ